MPLVGADSQVVMWSFWSPHLKIEFSTLNLFELIKNCLKLSNNQTQQTTNMKWFFYFL